MVLSHSFNSLVHLVHCTTHDSTLAQLVSENSAQTKISQRLTSFGNIFSASSFTLARLLEERHNCRLNTLRVAGHLPSDSHRQLQRLNNFSDAFTGSALRRIQSSDGSVAIFSPSISRLHSFSNHSDNPSTTFSKALKVLPISFLETFVKA